MPSRDQEYKQLQKTTPNREYREYVVYQNGRYSKPRESPRLRQTGIAAVEIAKVP